MSQPARLEERVTKLETEMAEVRFLATKAEKEASDFQAVLKGHTGTINAIREDQVEHGRKLARVEAEMRTGFARVDERFERLEAKVDDGFAKVDEKFAKIDENFTKIDENFTKVDENFARMGDKFTMLHQGQVQITALLTRHINECEKS